MLAGAAVLDSGRKSFHSFIHIPFALQLVGQYLCEARNEQQRHPQPRSRFGRACTRAERSEWPHCRLQCHQKTRSVLPRMEARKISVPLRRGVSPWLDFRVIGATKKVAVDRTQYKRRPARHSIPSRSRLQRPVRRRPSAACSRRTACRHPTEAGPRSWYRLWELVCGHCRVCGAAATSFGSPEC